MTEHRDAWLQGVLTGAATQPPPPEEAKPDLADLLRRYHACNDWMDETVAPNTTRAMTLEYEDYCQRCAKLERIINQIAEVDRCLVRE